MRLPIGFGLFVAAAFMSSISVADDVLRPYAKNPFYWQYKGEPVLLLGGSDDDNLFQHPDLENHLDKIEAVGGNFIRNTMSDRRDKGFEVYPFQKIDNGKYDLDRWNEEYWDRFEKMLRWTGERRIFVQIEVWDRFDLSDSKGMNNWQRHPYNPKNNVNYSYKESGFAKRYQDHPGQNKQPFYFTTPGQRNNEMILRRQQRFVNKMLDHSLKYDHVLYCMDNETSADEAWGAYWATFIRDRAEGEGKTVFVTEMWDDWKLQGPNHRRTFDHPELYGFVDVSQNTHQSGQRNWEALQFVRRYLADKPRPINTVKTYGAAGGRFGHSRDGVERWWRHLIGGAAAVRFHRPDAGLGLSEPAGASIEAARKLESLVTFWTMSPANELLGDRSENEAYLAADPGSAYALFFTNGGAVSLELPVGDYGVRWIKIDDASWGPESAIKGGGKVEIQTPGKQAWVAAIVKQAD